MATRTLLAILLILSMLSASAAPAPSPAPPTAADREFKVFLPTVGRLCTIYSDREPPRVDIATYLDGVRTDTVPYNIPVEIRLTVSDNCDPSPSSGILVNGQEIWHGAGSHTMTHVFDFPSTSVVRGFAKDTFNRREVDWTLYPTDYPPTIEVLSGPGVWENVSDHKEYVVRIEVGQPLEPIVLRFQDQNSDAMEAVLQNFPDGSSIVETPGTGIWTLTLPTDRSLLNTYLNAAVRAQEVLRNDYFGTLEVRLSYQDTIPPQYVGVSRTLLPVDDQSFAILFNEPISPMSLIAIDGLRSETPGNPGSGGSTSMGPDGRSIVFTADSPWIPGFRFTLLTTPHHIQDLSYNHYVGDLPVPQMEVEWDPQAYVDMFLTGLNKAYFDNGLTGHPTANWIIFGQDDPNPQSPHFNEFVEWLTENNLHGATA